MVATERQCAQPDRFVFDNDDVRGGRPDVQINGTTAMAGAAGIFMSKGVVDRNGREGQHIDPQTHGAVVREELGNAFLRDRKDADFDIRSVFLCKNLVVPFDFFDWEGNLLLGLISDD